MNCFAVCTVPLASAARNYAVCSRQTTRVSQGTRRVNMTAASPAASPALTSSPKCPPKRLCIFSDGSWMTPETESLSNIAVLAQAIEYAGSECGPQMVYYDPGLGSEGNVLERVMGGAIGAGIDLNIQQLYTFLVMNYVEGDEIYMFGYSRGAYTVRSLAGMMNHSGLLHRDRLECVKEAYDCYRGTEDSQSLDAEQFRKKYDSRDVPIKLITCFDTVGALGVPEVAPFPLRLFSKEDKYRFHDTTLSPNIENAIHVLSIDEDSATFEPTLMSSHPKVGETQLTQVYMPGRHGGIGGGNARGEPLARNAALFVLEEMKKRKLAVRVDTSVVPDKYVTDVEPSPPPPRFSAGSIIGMGKKPRKIASLDMVHPIALDMYRKLPNWRPASLEPWKDDILGN